MVKNTKNNINCLYLRYLSDTGKCKYPKQLSSNLDNSDYSHHISFSPFLSLSLSLSLSLLIMV